MKPIHLSFSDSADPEGCRQVYVLGYRAGYSDGQANRMDARKAHQNQEEILTMPIEAMKLTSRAYNVLLHGNCRYVWDVANLPVEKIRVLRNLGKVTAQEIAQALKELGITGTDWELIWLI